MHELGIAQSILEAVETESARHAGARPKKVGIRIGELAAVDPDSLRFSFEVLTQDLGFDNLELDIQSCPRRHRCLDCGIEFEIKDFNFCCPRCGSTRNDCVSGEELEIAYLELEEHEPSTA